MRRVCYYESFDDDFVESANQTFTLPQDYQWIPKGVWNGVKSGVIYTLALVFGGLYAKLWLWATVKNRKVLRGIRGGFFLYGNHTQPVGDVFIPALCVFPRRIYTLASPANFGIPVIGRLQPWLGALPVVNTLGGIRELTEAMETRLRQGSPIVVYPEAHVWEYCSFIRPFPPTTMKYPVKFGVPAFSMTVTYQKGGLRKLPRAVVYLDGPFVGEGNGPREKAADLHQKIVSAMEARARESNCNHIEYRKKTDPGKD